ncbi:MAG: hypothetical protein LBL45_03920 [Treponema sp.]|jgi:hypothetical protein|nr:hypothetical protein [Treponema sp.]
MEYYIPQKEAEMIEWSGNLIAVSKENIDELELPADQLAALETEHVRLKALHEKCQTPAHTSLDIQEKNDLKTAFLDKVKLFVRFHLQNNEKMTDALRRAAGIPIYDTKPTHHPPPDSHPVITVESRNPFELILRIRDSESGKRAKPEHVAGAVLFWRVSETPIADPKALTSSALVTRASYVMRFPASERGKIVYMAGRWQNGIGEQGPPGEVTSAVIP